MVTDVVVGANAELVTTTATTTSDADPESKPVHSVTDTDQDTVVFVAAHVVTTTAEVDASDSSAPVHPANSTATT